MLPQRPPQSDQQALPFAAGMFLISRFLIFLMSVGYHLLEILRLGNLISELAFARELAEVR